MKKFIWALIVVLSLVPYAAVMAAEVSIGETVVDGNIINYTVSCDDKEAVINTALFCGGKLIGVNTGTGDKTFCGPSNADCYIKAYPIDKNKGVMEDSVKTAGVHTLGSKYIETLIIYPKDNASLKEAAWNIRETIGGDMAFMSASLPLNPELYDTIFLGYTQKNGQMDDATAKLLDAYDFGTSTIVPFCDGEVNNTDRAISLSEPQALIQNSFNAHGKGKAEVEEWLNEIGYFR